jgi:hypothetical protein
MGQSSRGWERQRIDHWREWWELVFYCWRWLLVLIPATAEAVAAIVAICEGRSPTLFLNPFK